MLRVSVAAAVLLAFSGCRGADGTPPPGESLRRSFAQRLGREFVEPRLATLVERSEALRTSTTTLEASAGSDDGARQAARTALVALQQTWQQLEVMQLGPAGVPAKFTGGLGLRDGINSWPQTSACGADQQVVQNRFADADFLSGRLPNVLGLHTLEYVLFRDDDGNACPESASINADGRWAALSAADIRARRATYARVLAGDVTTKALALQAAWRDGYGTSLQTAGTEGSSFATAQQALDEVYAALFAVELVVKDRKLAVPAGLRVECEGVACHALTESPYARLSHVHVANNLRGAALVFTGTNDEGVDGVGLDDLLRDGGHDDVANDMVAAANAAVAAAEGFSGTFEDVLPVEPARVIALHDTVKAFTDGLKTELPSLLGLRVPDEGAGDND
jgi:predicted lipoprotein